MDLSVKANKKQGDYTEVLIQAAHSCCYGSVLIWRSGNKLIVLFRKNLERALFYSSGSSSGCCTAQPAQKGISKACVLLSLRRAQLGKKAVQYVTSVPVSLLHGMDAGSTPTSLGFQSWAYLQTEGMCKQRMSWPVAAPRSDCTCTLPQDQNHHKRDLAAKITLQSSLPLCFCPWNASIEYFGVITEHQKLQGQIIALNGKRFMICCGNC